MSQLCVQLTVLLVKDCGVVSCLVTRKLKRATYHRIPLNSLLSIALVSRRHFYSESNKSFKLIILLPLFS